MQLDFSYQTVELHNYLNNYCTKQKRKRKTCVSREENSFLKQNKNKICTIHFGMFNCSRHKIHKDFFFF